MATASTRIQQARGNLEKASCIQKRFYNSRHSPSPLKAGDRVFILLEDHPVHSLICGMHKLRDNKWGPVSIVEMVGTQAVRLDLPPSSRIHPVISILHLQPFVEDSFARSCKPPPAAIIDGDEAWEVDHIIGERVRRRRTAFKVKWVGSPDTECTWEPESNLRHDLGPFVEELIDNYRHRCHAAARVASLPAFSPLGPSGAFSASTCLDRPIHFISSVLKSYEENDTIPELEMAAMVWAILKFQRYLDWSIFTVVTDYQSLLSITESSSSTLYSARLDKWRMLLAPYSGQMTLVHRSGQTHGNADGLSRSCRRPSHETNVSAPDC